MWSCECSALKFAGQHLRSLSIKNPTEVTHKEDGQRSGIWLQVKVGAQKQPFIFEGAGIRW